MNMSDKLANGINCKLSRLINLEKKDYIRGKIDAYLDVFELCNKLDIEDIQKMQSIFERDDLNLDVKRARKEVRE